MREREGTPGRVAKAGPLLVWVVHRRAERGAQRARTVDAMTASDSARLAPRDLREGGRWTRAQSVKNGLIAALVRVALAVVVPLPRGLSRAIGRIVGVIAFLIFPASRRIAMANVALAFPHLAARDRQAIVRRTYLTLGGHLGDAVGSLDPHRAIDPLPIDADSLALLTQDRKSGGGPGVVFASAHLGPWERVAHSLVQHGVPLTTLARETYDARLSDVYDRLRAARGVRVIYRGHPGAAARIVRTLRAGGVLGVPMDLRSRVPSIDVEFLGRMAPTAVGPARIALRTGATVIVGTVAPSCGTGGGAGALCITCTLIGTTDLADLPCERERERVLSTRINAELARRILDLPSEWVWMHDRFGESNPVV